MQNILIIGGGGFIGTNLNAYLCEVGYINEHRLVILNRGTRSTIQHQNIDYREGDYRDRVLLNSLFRQYNFSKVIHLASSTVPVISNQTILEDIQNDLRATITLLEIMLDHNCRYIMFFSSGGALYGSSTTLIARKESDACNPISSYGILKWTTEQYIRLFERKYGMEYVILRPSNIYGEFHNSELQGLINVAIRRAMRGESLEIWGSGKQQKDYLYVKDAVKIVYLLLTLNHKNCTLNIGSGENTTINQIVDIVKEVVIDFSVYHKPTVDSDVQNFCLDISQLKALLPNLSLTGILEGIEKTYRWENNTVPYQNERIK